MTSELPPVTDIEAVSRKIIFDEFGIDGESGIYLSNVVTAAIGIALAAIQEDLRESNDRFVVAEEFMVEHLMPFARKHDTEHAEEYERISNLIEGDKE